MAMASHAGAGGARGEKFWAAAILLFLGLLFSGLGAAALAKVSWGQVGVHLAARDWPAADAMVESVSLTEVVGGGARGLGTSRRLQLAVSYSYSIDGVIHEGTTASLADTGDLDDRRLKLLYSQLKFAEVTSRSVPATYNPAAPHSAYLDTTFPWRSAALHGGLGIGFLAAGLALLAALLRSLRAQA